MSTQCVPTRAAATEHDRVASTCSEDATMSQTTGATKGQGDGVSSITNTACIDKQSMPEANSGSSLAAILMAQQLSPCLRTVERI